LNKDTHFIFFEPININNGRHWSRVFDDVWRKGESHEEKYYRRNYGRTRKVIVNKTMEQFIKQHGSF
jgi:hypothetical protein